MMGLVAKAQALTGLKEKSSLVREALKALIERKSTRRLARLGGGEPAVLGGRRTPARSDRERNGRTNGRSPHRTERVWRCPPRSCAGIRAGGRRWPMRPVRHK